FDGSSLEHWKHYGLPGQGDYAAADGVLKKESQVDLGLLAHDQELSDFVLQLEYRLNHIDDKARVYFRLRPHGNRPPTQSLAVNLVDDRGTRQGGRTSRRIANARTNGALYEVIEPDRPVDLPFGDWHKLEVRAVGPKITVRIDRKTVLDVH